MGLGLGSPVSSHNGALAAEHNIGIFWSRENASGCQGVGYCCFSKLVPWLDFEQSTHVEIESIVRRCSV